MSDEHDAPLDIVRVHGELLRRTAAKIDHLSRQASRWGGQAAQQRVARHHLAARQPQRRMASCPTAIGNRNGAPPDTGGGLSALLEECKRAGLALRARKPAATVADGKEIDPQLVVGSRR
jgi:hypothetical protein